LKVYDFSFYKSNSFIFNLNYNLVFFYFWKIKTCALIEKIWNWYLKIYYCLLRWIWIWIMIALTINFFSLVWIVHTWWHDIIIFFQDNSIRFFFFWLEIKILECTSFGWSHNQFLHFNWEMHPIFTSIKTKWFLNKKRQL